MVDCWVIHHPPLDFHGAGGRGRRPWLCKHAPLSRTGADGPLCSASQCGAKSNIFNPSLGLKNSRFALIFRYIPYIPLAQTINFATYIGIVCDPSIEFIINRPRRNKTTMAKTASAIIVPLVGRRSYDTGTFLNPLGTPLRKGFDVGVLD